MKTFPAIRGHKHVETGHQGVRAIGRARTNNLSVSIPIAHDDTIKTPMGLEQIRQKGLVAMHLAAAPAGERGHDGLDPSIECRIVAGGVYVPHFRFGCDCLSLVLAGARPSIPDEMLGGRNDLV